MLQSLVGNLTDVAERSSPPDEVTTFDRIDDTPDDAVGLPYAAPAAPDLDDATIVHLVRKGIAKDRVDLVLQPVVSLPQRKRKFYEAYTRIRCENGDVITPGQYIAIAEREGLVTALDNLLLFRCVQQLRSRHNKNRNIGFFCNISPHTLADKKFFNDFIAFLTENLSLPQDPIFEFSRAMIANQEDEISHQLRRLAALGFRSIRPTVSISITQARPNSISNTYRSMPKPCCAKCRSRQRISTFTISKRARTSGHRSGGQENRNQGSLARHSRFPRRFRSGLFVRRTKKVDRRPTIFRCNTGSAPPLRPHPIRRIRLAGQAPVRYARRGSLSEARALLPLTSSLNEHRETTAARSGRAASGTA